MIEVSAYQCRTISGHSGHFGCFGPLLRCLWRHTDLHVSRKSEPKLFVRAEQNPGEFHEICTKSDFAFRGDFCVVFRGGFVSCFGLAIISFRGPKAGSTLIKSPRKHFASFLSRANLTIRFPDSMSFLRIFIFFVF